MSKGSEAVKKWRQLAKKRLIRAFGGSCCICGYNKCDEVLEFHHLDPSTKETSWGAIRGNIKSWNRILEEMRKCVMVCSNCHKEVHAKFTTIPLNAPRLDEVLADYRAEERKLVYSACPICNKPKLNRYKTCSPICARTNQKNVDWDNHNIIELLNIHKTYTAVGDLLGVSAAAVSRKLKQLQTGKW